MNIVQIGTCKGNDELFELFSLTRADNLVLVEPMYVHNDAIHEKYKNLNYSLENCAITANSEKTIQFFYHLSDGPLYEVASVNRNHILKHGYSPIGLMNLVVPCMSINQLFEKHNFTEIDFLWIDAEGLDDVIIKDINFDKFKINQIYFEALHIDVPSVINYLDSKGYKTETGVGKNHWDCLSTKI